MNRLQEIRAILAKAQANTAQSKLEHFRKKILEHLEGLDRVEPLAKGAKLPIGTIREWKGKKYVKVAPNRWRPKYDSESRGAKLAVAAIKRKVSEAKTAQEMLQIVLENRDRFSDKQGNPLPFVQELSDYVKKQGGRLEAAQAKPAKPKKERAVADRIMKLAPDMGGGGGGEPPDDDKKNHTSLKDKIRQKPVANEKEQKTFIAEALSDRTKKGRLKLGNISDKAQERIKAVIGDVEVSSIFTDMDSVRHAHDVKHNLDADDFQRAVEVINTTTDIELSGRQHADNDVLIFKKDISRAFFQPPGEITFLTEVHVKNGYLHVFNCWKQKKSRNRPDAANKPKSESPPMAHVRNVTPPNLSSSKPLKKSSEKPSIKKSLAQNLKSTLESLERINNILKEAI